MSLQLLENSLNLFYAPSLNKQDVIDNFSNLVVESTSAYNLSFDRKDETPKVLSSQKYKIKDLVNDFDALNHGQIGKIIQFRLKSAMEQRRKLMEQNKQEDDITKECTFQPTLNGKSVKIDQKRVQQSLMNSRKTSSERIAESPMRREHQLHQYAKEVQERNEKLKEMRDRIELEKTPFKPKISEKSKLLAQESQSVSYFRHYQELQRNQAQAV